MNLWKYIWDGYIFCFVVVFCHFAVVNQTLCHICRLMIAVQFLLVLMVQIARVLS